MLAWQEQRAADDLYRKTLRFLVSAGILGSRGQNMMSSPMPPISYIASSIIQRTLNHQLPIINYIYIYHHNPSFIIIIIQNYPSFIMDGDGDGDWGFQWTTSQLNHVELDQDESRWYDWYVDHWLIFIISSVKLNTTSGDQNVARLKSLQNLFLDSDEHPKMW